MNTTAARTGYLASYTATFQIEGVTEAQAARIHANLQRRMAQAFHELAADAAEISAGNVGNWYGEATAESADGRKVHTRFEPQQHSLDTYDIR